MTFQPQDFELVPGILARRYPWACDRCGVHGTLTVALPESELVRAGIRNRERRWSEQFAGIARSAERYCAACRERLA